MGNKRIISISVIFFVVISISLLSIFYFSPFYQIQAYHEQTSCEKADLYLDRDGKNYEEAKRFSPNPVGQTSKYQITNLSDKQYSSIIDCGIENLPSLVSNILETKVGFLQGVDSHLADGKVSLIEIESGHYLRISDYELKYLPGNDSLLIVPEFHVYLKMDVGDGKSEEKYLEQLKERVGDKNYRIDSKDAGKLTSVIIRNAVVNPENDFKSFEIVAEAKMNNPPNVFTLISWSLHKMFNSIDNPTSQSKMIYEKIGRFEGINDVKAKGTLYADFEEDNADIVIDSYELTSGPDLNIYLTSNGVPKHPSGGWIFNPIDNLVYVSSTNNDEILRYDVDDGTFVDVFVSGNNLNGPKDLLLSSDGKYLYVINTDGDILRYDVDDGTFVDVFVSGNNLTDAILSSDGKYLYVINTDGDILRYDVDDGTFVDVFVSGNNLTDAILSSDGKYLYVINTDGDILRYDVDDGTFVDVFVSGNNSLQPKDLLLSSDGKYLFVSNYFDNEILRFDIESKQKIKFITPHDGKIDEPSSILFGPDSTLWVSSTGTDQLLQFDSATGIFLNYTESTVPFEEPTGLAMGPHCENNFSNTCTVYVSDSKNNSILQYDPNQNKLIPFIENLENTAPDHIEFGPPTCNVDLNECFLFVSFPDANQIQKYDINGNFVGDFLLSKQVKSPQSFTFDQEGSLYVSSWKTDEVLKYSNNGTYLGPFSTSGGLNGPGGLTFDENESRLFVTSKENHSVFQYNGTNGLLIKSPTEVKKEFIERDISGMVLPDDVKLHDGFFYILSQKTDELFKYDKSGEFIEKFIFDRSNNLIKPNKLGFVENQLCVSSGYTNSIQCYDESNGQFERKLTTSFNKELNTSKFSEIGGLDGELYVSHPLFNQVDRYENISGLFIDNLISGEKTLLQGPRYLVMGPDDDLYVSSANNNEIIRYDGTTGNFIEIFVTPDSGGLDSPHGLTFDEFGNLYVSSHDNHRILRYDSTGNFIDDFISSRNAGLLEPRGIVYHNDHFFVVSYGSNEILKFNKSAQRVSLYEINGPEDIAVGKNNTLYVVSSIENQIYTIDSDSNAPPKILEKVFGPDFDNPKGITFAGNALYVSNQGIDQVIKYNLNTKVTSFLDELVNRPTLKQPHGLLFEEESGNLFITSVELHRVLRSHVGVSEIIPDPIFDEKFTKKDLGLDNPLDLTFHPKTSDLYVISGKNHDIWKYDAATTELLGSSADFQNQFDPILSATDLDGKLRNLVFSHDGNHLFISSPFEDLIYKHKIDSKPDDPDVFTPLPKFSDDDSELNHPTEIILGNEPNTLFVVSYGSNLIHRLNSITGNLEFFVNPTLHGLVGIEKLVLGQDSNLYVLGNDRTVHRYDTKTKAFLGEFDLGGIPLGTLPENLLGKKFNINRVNTTDYNQVVIYDDYLEKTYSKIILTDARDFGIVPFTAMFNAITAQIPLFISDDKVMKSLDYQNKAGYFSEDHAAGIEAIGQADVHIADDVAQINIHGFEIHYNQTKYVNYGAGQGITDGPKLHACLTNNSTIACDEQASDQGYLGRMSVNVGDEVFLTKAKYLIDDGYNYIVISDTGLDYSESDDSPVVSYIQLHDYWFSRLSVDLLGSWISNEFWSILSYTLTLLIIPLFFDYIRTAGKIIVLSVVGSYRKFRKKEILSQLKLTKKLTIMIPAYNEELGIEESIKAAISNSYPNKEIIVIDDASKDDTYKIAKKYADSGQIRLLHRTTGSGSKAAALNYGAQFATGDLVLCMDGDTILDKNAISNAINKFDDTQVHAVSGNVKIKSGDGGVNNILTDLQKYEYLIAIELGRSFTSLLNVLLVISGAFGIFRKQYFDGLSQFHIDTITEDFDLTLRTRLRGGKIPFARQSIAWTYCPTTWSEWKRQRIRWAHGQLETMIRHSGMLRFKKPQQKWKFWKFFSRDQIAIFDMWALDVAMNFLFVGYVLFLIILVPVMTIYGNIHILANMVMLVIGTYIISEFTIFTAALVLSKEFKKNWKLLKYVPMMAMVYRPYLKFIVVSAYIQALRKKKAQW